MFKKIRKILDLRTINSYCEKSIPKQNLTIIILGFRIFTSKKKRKVNINTFSFFSLKQQHVKLISHLYFTTISKIQNHVNS